MRLRRFLMTEPIETSQKKIESAARAAARGGEPRDSLADPRGGAVRMRYRRGMRADDLVIRTTTEDDWESVRALRLEINAEAPWLCESATSEPESLLFSYVEHWTWFEGVYFCYITLTTIGFGTRC